MCETIFLWFTLVTVLLSGVLIGTVGLDALRDAVDALEGE